MGAIIACFGHNRSPGGLTADQQQQQQKLDQLQQNFFQGVVGKREVELLKKDKSLRKLIAGAEPEELSGIGTYLLQHLDRDLERQNLSRVEMAVNIMEVLLENCRRVSSWPFLVQNYMEMVKRLLQMDEPILETMGTQLFQRHIKWHKYVGENLCKDYNQIAQKFMTFMNSGNDARRMNGFNGIKVICSNIQNYAVRRDQKWARELFSKILDLMLIEFLYKTTKTATAGKYLANGAPNGIDGNAAGAEGSDFVDSEVDFRTLFISYLRELVFRCKPEHLHMLIEPILKHLTVTNSWNMPNQFITNFIVAIMAESGDDKMDLFLQSLIAHIKHLQTSASTDELCGMGTLLANYVPLVARPLEPDVKSMKSVKMENKIQELKIQRENFLGIMELLQMSMEMAKTRKDTKLFGEYQDKLIDAINKMSTGVPDKMRLQAAISAGAPLPVMIVDQPFFKSPIPTA